MPARSLDDLISELYPAFFWAALKTKRQLKPILG